MARMDGTWGGTVALILRDCEPEARLEFMRSLGQWKRNSQHTLEESEQDGDRLAAESRLVKLTALEEHLQREMDSDAQWKAMFRDMTARWRL